MAGERSEFENFFRIQLKEFSLVFGLYPRPLARRERQKPHEISGLAIR